MQMPKLQTVILNVIFLSVICQQLFLSTCSVGAAPTETTPRSPALKSKDSENLETSVTREPKIGFPAYRADYLGLRMFPGWFKPRRDEKKYNGSSLLLVKLLADGSAILNPKDEDGRSTNAINLKGLSYDNAQMLWGKPHQETTFDLLSDSRKEMDVYHIDTKFDRRVLSSYRVRGIGIPKPAWKNVE